MADNDTQGKQPRTAADVRKTAEAAIKNARVKAFHDKLKPELEKLTAAEDAVAVQTAKIDAMCEEFDAQQQKA
jgi:hypothetical protein